jgi:hypothetical protein
VAPPHPLKHVSSRDATHWTKECLRRTNAKAAWTSDSDFTRNTRCVLYGGHRTPSISRKSPLPPRATKFKTDRKESERITFFFRWVCTVSCSQHRTELLPHTALAYFPLCLAPWDFYLSPRMKKRLKGCHFKDTAVVQGVAGSLACWLPEMPQRLCERLEKRVAAEGQYLKRDRVWGHLSASGLEIWRLSSNHLF